MPSEIFSYKFKEPDLLKIALTHPSTKNQDNYQKFEFLGDRVLGLIMAEFVFKNFPSESEGDLAKRQVGLVRGEVIADIAAKNNLGEMIIMSYGEESTGGRENPSNLEDAMEAVIGAIYLDGGLAEIQKIVLNLWQNKLTEFSEPPQDAKSELQEYLQKIGYELPKYELIGQSGPAHEPVFEMAIKVDGLSDVTVEAGSKKSAEHELARLMLENLKKK